MKGLQRTLNSLKHSEALEKRIVYEEIVQWQPQYIGQKPYIPYYYSKFQKHEASDVSEDCITFNVTETDRTIFPELKKVKKVKLKTAYGRVLEA